MVQVDVFWSYGIGSTFALAAARQLRARAQAPPASGADDAPARWTDPYLLRTLLFLALVFVPSGVYLVWGYPSWETMHAGDKSMPAWLVTLFAATNVTQGILGYLVTQWLLVRGRSYLAYLQMIAGYLGMFFILVHGWDGTGYQRFFSETRADFLAWDGDWVAWLTSGVATSLYVMGAILVPVLLAMASRWHVDGYRLDPVPAGWPRPGRTALAALMLTTIFAVALPIGIAAHLVIEWAGGPVGAIVAVALAAAALSPAGPAHWLYRRLALPDGRLDLQVRDRPLGRFRREADGLREGRVRVNG